MASNSAGVASAPRSHGIRRDFARFDSKYLNHPAVVRAHRPLIGWAADRPRAALRVLCDTKFTATVSPLMEFIRVRILPRIRSNGSRRSLQSVAILCNTKFLAAWRKGRDA